MSNFTPYTILPKTSGSPVLCFCDHATNFVPKAFDNLGLSQSDLNRHIGWDIGAANLTRQLCSAFGGTGLLAGFSRLLIDPNRDLDDRGLISEISDGTKIPSNQDLSSNERQLRIAQYYEPYHQALENLIDETVNQFNDPLIISIHSFTTKPASGTRRELDIGILWKIDEDNAVAVKDAIERVHPYKIGLNEPYSALKLNHTMDQHVIPRGLRHITLEIRQDLIDTDAGATKMAEHLSQGLGSFIGG
ncbi:MAG: N-formylglutamate amidohydrolase [Robiginitomaculum sp.]|nr:N-formylglutamate amidohydrolase [Robiginitomaculum sp.]